MNVLHNIWIAGIIIMLVNLPFGFWRGGTRKFSLTWFLAVHIPVPLVAGVRIVTGLGWHLVTFPVFISAFATGQLIGGKLRHWFRE